MSRTMLTIIVLDAYALEIIHGFPLGEDDKLMSRKASAGCTTLVYEVTSDSLRTEQRVYLDEVREVMLDRLTILRHSKSRRGLTLFSWKSYSVAPPRHDLALLERQPWKEAILAAAR